MAPLIYPNSREDATMLARELLDVAGPERHDEVKTTSDGPLAVAFDVPEDLARTWADGSGVVDVDGGPDSQGQAMKPGREPEPEPAAKLEPEPAAGEKSMSADAGADATEADVDAGDTSRSPARAPRARPSRRA